MHCLVEDPKRQSYDDHFIAIVTMEARQVGYAAVAHKHEIHEDTACTWLNFWRKNGKCFQTKKHRQCAILLENEKQNVADICDKMPAAPNYESLTSKVLPLWFMVRFPVIVLAF